MIDNLDFLELEELDEEFRKIPESEYIPELEEKVQQYIKISPDLPRNSIKYEHLKYPKFDTPEAHKAFWREQIKRCMNGYNGMCGKMYFFYNFCWMENIKGGKIRPEFRVVDNEWFKLVEACQKSRHWGIVCVKRRRVGASWKEAADVIHDCLFSKHRHIGMNSKSVRDSEHLLKKVKFLYNNLPKELRVRTSAGYSKDFIDFSYYKKDEQGNKIRHGNQSDIVVVAPVNQAFEGQILSKWVCDEAGKIENLPDMWAFTEDCLMDQTRRSGIPIIFGTSGDVGKEGAGLREMWEHHEMYKLKRFFFAGWMGVAVDEYGNDNKEEVIRWIVYERKQKEANQNYYNIFVQKYPLTVKEAFQDRRNLGMGDPVKLESQRTSLLINPPFSKRGLFKETENGDIIFVPHQYGPCIIYQDPDRDFSGEYVSGCDPADMDDVFGEASDLSMYIMTKPHGLKRPSIVFEYTDRPRELNTYYRQAILALRYYYNCKILIERQKGGRMISYFTDNGYRSLLNTTPQLMRRLTPTRAVQIGVNMGPMEKEYMRGLGSEYVDDYYDIIPSIPLIEELQAFGSKNTDKAMAFGITLMQLREETSKRAKNSLIGNRRIEPNIKYSKDSLGRIIRIPRY